MTAADLREAMARLAAGVAVLAAPDGDGFRGLTVTSLTGVSLEPPLVLVCLDRLSQTRDLVLEARRFAISVLARGQGFVAERFSGRAPVVERTWRDVPHFLAPGGLPVIDGALAWLECGVAQVHEAGDHDIVVGAVEAAGIGPGDPLVLWDREFWSLS
jgi:flavin reductase (DIM6/NTAB) family NADH-FMN oxidoreductase RutF